MTAMRASLIFERQDISWTQLLYALAANEKPRETLAGFRLDYAELEDVSAK
jgi:hypothetical protein